MRVCKQHLFFGAVFLTAAVLTAAAASVSLDSIMDGTLSLSPPAYLDAHSGVPSDDDTVGAGAVPVDSDMSCAAVQTQLSSWGQFKQNFPKFGFKLVFAFCPISARYCYQKIPATMNSQMSWLLVLFFVCFSSQYIWFMFDFHACLSKQHLKADSNNFDKHMHEISGLIDSKVPVHVLRFLSGLPWAICALLATMVIQNCRTFREDAALTLQTWLSLFSGIPMVNNVFNAGNPAVIGCHLVTWALLVTFNVIMVVCSYSLMADNERPFFLLWLARLSVSAKERFLFWYRLRMFLKLCAPDLGSIWRVFDALYWCTVLSCAFNAGHYIFLKTLTYQEQPVLF